jgi:hypothetical protein
MHGWHQAAEATRGYTFIRLSPFVSSKFRSAKKYSLFFTTSSKKFRHLYVFLSPAMSFKFGLYMYSTTYLNSQSSLINSIWAIQNYFNCLFDETKILFTIHFYL